MRQKGIAPIEMLVVVAMVAIVVAALVVLMIKEQEINVPRYTNVLNTSVVYETAGTISVDAECYIVAARLPNGNIRVCTMPFIPPKNFMIDSENAIHAVPSPQAEAPPNQK